MQAASVGAHAPRAPPNDREKKLMDVLLHAADARVAPLLACVKGWPLEAQADLANWRAVLLKLHRLLLAALQQCPRLLLVENDLEKTQQPIAVHTEQELAELVLEILKFSAFLLENAANKAVYPSAEPVMALLAARNERVVAEATKVVAMLALPPQVHRYAADPTSFVDPAASRNSLLRRRLLIVAQGRGTPKNSLEVVDYLSATGPDAARDVDFQFYSSEQEGDEDAAARVVNVAIPPYEEIVGASTTPAEAACAAATACERLIEQYNIPKRLHFRLFTQVRACYAARSALARENLVVERLYALLALFSLFSDAWDVTNYVEQHPELTRGVVELIRVESIERVPVRVRVAALLVLTALVNDRVGRAGGMGVLGRQSNVLQALGVVKGTPHGVFPSLVRFCMAELGDVSALSSTATTSGSPLPTETDTDMDMSLAVAFVQATTDLLSPQEAEVVSAPPFRSVSSGNVQEAKLCWMEAVLGLLTTVVAIQSGAAVLTENGIVPALLHVLTIPSVSTFHMAVTTQCVQALEITVSSHSAAAALYRDLNGVGILVDRLKLESASIVGGKRSPTSSANSETKTVLLLAILASLSMSFHSQGVMSAGATSRAIREGSALNKVLLQLLSNVDVFGPVVFAQAAVVVSDVINNDPSSVNHVHAAGLADAFLKTLTRWDIAELYPSRILLPPSSELLTAVPTVLNALCLTTTHAEKVAKYEPLMHLLDVFALPQYTEDEAKDYCFQGDTAAAVGAGIFELMRHVPSFQNAAIQAAVHALKKVIRFGEESKQTLTSSAQHVSEDKDHNILIRMTTHVADLLEPLLSKSEHAAYFADLGGIRLLLALYQLILPSTSSFLDGALPNKKAARTGSPQSSLAHNPAVQSITLALRSYASQQPTNLLAAIVKELSSQMDSLQRARANVGLPWYLSESGEGAEGVLSSLPDIDLAKLITAEDISSVANTSADKVMVAGEYLRVLAVLEWLASVLIWTLETAHTHMQSRRWFTDFTTPSTQHVMARLFRVDRSVQFERASLAALHQKKRKEKGKESKEVNVAGDVADASMELTSSTGEEKTNSVEAELSKRSRGAGLWKMGSLLLLRFSLSMRGLLTAYGKVFLSAPMQHRRGDDIVVPLAPHARKLARTVTQILEGHLLYVVSVNRATQIDTFVQQYYLTFLLETISVVLFEGKKKQANTLLLVELMKPLCDISDMQTLTKPPQSPRVAPASIEDVPMIQEGESDAAKSGKTIATCAGAQITASNLMDVVMNIIERFFAVCVEGERDQSSESGTDDVVKPSQMALTSFHIAASVLRKLANLEGLSASPLTAALLTSDEAGESDEAPFEPRKLTAQLHGMCVRALLSVWKHPKFAYSPVDSCLAEVMPIAVTILKNRMDNDDEAAGSDGEDELSGSGRRQGLGFSRGNRERNSSTELYNEALSLRRALFGGTRGAGSSGSSRHQSFVPDTEIVDSLVSMGFQQSRVERALRQIQVNNVELAMEWILGHPEDEGEDEQHDEADNEDVAAGDALRREKEAADEKKFEEDLQALYISLRDSFESVCFQILRVQADKKKQDAAKRQATDVAQAEASSNFYPSQNLVKAIAEYFSFLCSRSDEDRDLVIQRLNAAVLDYFHEDEEGGDEYLTMMAHLLALVLQLNSDAWTVMQLQSPSCIDKLVAFVSSAGTNKDGSLKPSCTPILLVLDAAVAGKTTKRLSTSPSSTVDDAHVGSEAKINDESNEGSRQSMNQAEESAFEQQLVGICLQLLKQASLSVPSVSSTMTDNKTLAHAIWQLLSRLTLKYDLASYFSAHGGLDAILDIPEGLFFVGYQELTSTLLSQALESPEVLEHMMEDKIRRAITKLSTRFGAPSQMRITPRALLTEVAPFAARNEAVFLRALQNSVRVKKTESGRTYILPIPKKSDGSDAPPPGQPVDQPNVSLESGTSCAKTPHKLPKDHKHHAHVIVNKIIGRIRKLWGEEKSANKQHEAHQTPGNEGGSVSAGLCVGVYLQLLVHLITYFPACATVLAKAKDEPGAHGERGSFIRLVLCEFLPSRELCRFAASRKTLKEDGLYGNSRLGSGDSEQLLSDVKTFVESRTRMRVYNAHRLLVSIGSHSGEGSKCIILELVRLLQEWPQCNNHASKCDDLSVRDEHALSSLHAWSGLIMSILWPKGSSKGFAWDKVVLGGGLKGKHSFVTLLAEALRKIDLTHPLAHATCTMLLRPLSTLTRSFVTHRVRRLLKKRNHVTVSGSIESAEVSANNPDGEAPSTIPASAAIISTSSESNRETSSSRAPGDRDRMEVDTETRESTTNAGPGFYPLREEDDDDVPMRSPLSGMEDHDMHGDDEDDDHSDDHSDRSSVSDHSTDDGEGEEDEEDEDDDDDDDDDDDEDDDDDDDDDDDEDEDEDEFEEHQHLHMSRRTGGHGSSRRTSSNRLWGSLDSELSILDALDEVDEEEFSYLNMLDDEAFFAEEQRRRARLAAARNARPGNGTSEVSQQAGSSEDRLVESMRDALGLYNDGGGVSSSYSTGQTLVLTFGDTEDEEVEGGNQTELTTTRGGVGSGGGFGSSLGSQSRYGGGAGSVVSSSLLQYIEELPDMLDDDFLFESFDAGGRGDRSRRDRQLGRSGGNGIDQFTPNATTHPLLRTSGRGDASVLDSTGLMRNPGRLTLPRHSTLLRELQELTDQVQTQLPLGGSRSRLAIGRDLLQRGGGGSRGRPPSRINRLSAVSNLLSEFSLDIPSSLPSRHQRLSLRRGDRDIFGDVFVGVDLSRGLGSRAGDVIGGSASNSAMWGSSSVGRGVDIRSVASRLEQQITRICADDDEPPVSAGRRDREASSQRREDVDDIMEESSAVGTPRSGEHTASDPRAVDDAVESDAQPDASENSDRMERHDAATDAASVLELTSTLGESSLLRSPPESDVDVDIVEAEAETPSERQEASPAAASNPAATSILDSALPPPAPISLPAEASSTTAPATSSSMMNFTLDLSGFGATSTQSTTASDATNQARAVEEESKTEELPPTETQAVSVEAAAAQELSVESFDQQEGQQVYQCPEGMDAEVFASLPPDMQAEIVAQNAPAVAESTSARSDTATAGGGGGSESMSQLDLDMANSSFDRETLEALPPDIRAEVLENERREREAAARAETADTSRAQEMDNASFVASLAPELREEILVTCDDAFLQTLPSQVRAEAMVLRERAAFRSTYRERDRGTEGRGGGEGDMDELFNRPTLRRMLTSQTPETGSGRRRSRMYDELGGGRRSSRREYRQGAGSTKAHQGLLRVEKDEEEDARERIFDDRCVRGLLRLLFMTQSVIQNRVFQRLLANICLYPLTRCSVRRNLLRVISLPLAEPLVPGDERDDDDDGSGKIQFPPSSMYGCGIDGNRSIGGSAVPTEVVNRMLHVLVSLAKYNPRFTVEMLQPHGMRRQISVKSDSVKMDPSSGECGVAVLIDLLALPVVYRNGTNLDALLELLELVLSPLERLHKPRTDDEEKKEGEEGEAATPEPGDEWVAVPAVELDEARMGEIVAVLAMDLCTNQMQERTLAVLKLLNHVRGNRELVIRAVVRHASKLARVDRYKGDNASAETTGYESSAVLPSAQDELKLLRLLHSLSDVCENTAEFTECCQTIGLDPLWDALSVSLTEARAKGGLDDQDIGASAVSATQASSAVGSESQAAAASDDAEGTVIEGKSAGASCAMAALLARFLPMVEAFFVVNARDAASMSLRVPDSSEREEAVVAALRVGGFDGADATALMGTDEQKASPKSVLKRSSSVLSSVSIEAGETIRLANFVESNRVLLNLLVREKPSLLDTSLAALIKISRCRAYLAFDNKRTYFHSAMKRLRQTALRNHGGGSSSVRIPVRREHIFEDSYYALRMRSGTELRRKLHISFTGEEGIDAGGVTREWYMILAREMFNPNYVLFTSAADSPTFQPNPLSYVNKDHLSYFEFVGKVLGKAVADGQLLDAHFTRSFYKHILQLPISYHDMEAIDPEYYRNLHSILDNSIVDLGLELTFSAEQSNFGKVEVVDLIPNGRNVVVTDENKMEYVKLVTHHRMATGIRQQIDSFLKGFHQLVPPEMIAIFNENELELLISGMPEIDIDDLKANTEYANYKPTDSVIRWFWNVLYSFTHEERALFLQFVTGTSKVPLEGFKALEGMRGTQKFNIHKAFGNNSALPSAHTCFNQLDLPEYESEEKLKQCLLLAIREGSEGFGFG